MALFVAPTGVGKTQLALHSLEREYLNHFEFIIILCPTLRYNETYQYGIVCGSNWDWKNATSLRLS